MCVHLYSKNKSTSSPRTRKKQVSNGYIVSYFKPTQLSWHENFNKKKYLWFEITSEIMQQRIDSL